MKPLAPLLVVSVLVGAPLVAACDTADPTNAVVDNAFPPAPDGGAPSDQTFVFKVWWSVTLFPDPVGAGASSDENRVVPASDYAYALLAPHWDPSSGTPPTALIPVKTKDKISVARGDTVHITISDSTTSGDCAGGSTLSQDDADFITQRIFPGDFATVTYDASKCIATSIPADGGDEAGTEDVATDAATTGDADATSGDAAPDAGTD